MFLFYPFLAFCLSRSLTRTLHIKGEKKSIETVANRYTLLIRGDLFPIATVSSRLTQDRIEKTETSKIHIC